MPMKPDFVAFTIPNAFVVGYGLDYRDQYRNLPYRGGAGARTRSAMSKRILEIIPTLDRARGGEAVVPAGRRAAPDEFEVHVCALTRGGPLEADLAAAGIPLVVIGKRWKLDPRAFLAAETAYCRASARSGSHLDVCRQHLRFCGGPRPAASRMFVIGQRCVDPWKSRLQLTPIGQLARRCRGGGGQQRGRARFLRPARRAGRPRASDPQRRGDPESAQHHAATTVGRAGPARERRLIGLVGRLWPQKRVKDAIWAADLLKVIRDDVHLLIVGDGPQRDRLSASATSLHSRQGPFSRRARRRSPAPAPLRCPLVHQRLRGPIERDSRGDGLRRAGCGHRHSRHARIGRAGRDRLSHPRRRSRHSPKFTERLLNDAALAGRFSAAARQRVESAFSVAQMIERHAALYRELV